MGSFWSLIAGGGDSKQPLTSEQAEQLLGTAHQKIVKQIQDANENVKQLITKIEQQRGNRANYIDVRMMMSTAVVQNAFINRLLAMQSKLLAYQSNLRLAMTQDETITAISQGARSLDQYSTKHDVDKVDKIVLNTEKAIANMENIDYALDGIDTHSETTTATTSGEDDHRMMDEYDRIVKSMYVSPTISSSSNVTSEVDDALPAVPSSVPSISTASTTTGKIIELDKSSTHVPSLRDARFSPYTTPSSSSSSSSSPSPPTNSGTN